MKKTQNVLVWLRKMVLVTCQKESNKYDLNEAQW
jgi:hypothetical protein